MNWLCYFVSGGYKNYQIKEEIEEENISTVYEHNFKWIKGQVGKKWQQEIAAAGMHNILLVGRPEQGKRHCQG